jgi:hypothetical protein
MSLLSPDDLRPRLAMTDRDKTVGVHGDAQDATDDTLAPVEPWNYAVICLDLLGQNRAFDGIPDLITSRDSLDSAGAALKKSFGAVRLVRKLISTSVDLFHELSSSDPDNPTNRYMPKGIRVFSFADTVVSSLSLSPSASAASSLWSMLATHASAVMFALGAKVALRGGMAMGWAAPLGKDGPEIYGPALNRAHHLESQVAGRPRIVIDHRIVNYLHILRERSAQENDDNSVQTAMAAAALAFIMPEADNNFSLDFLCKTSSVMSQRGLGPARFTDMCRVVDAGHRFVAEQAEYWRGQGCAKLGDRYEATERYYASRLAFWRIEEEGTGDKTADDPGDAGRGIRGT